jgi:hypothetical protein
VEIKVSVEDIPDDLIKILVILLGVAVPELLHLLQQFTVGGVAEVMRVVGTSVARGDSDEEVVVCGGGFLASEGVGADAFGDEIEVDQLVHLS